MSLCEDDVINYLDNRLKPWIEAESILKGGLLYKIGYKNKQPLEIVAACISAVKPTNPPYRITFNLQIKPDGSNLFAILRGDCSCDGGASGKCKHCTAVLKYLMKVPVTQIEQLSPTDDVCRWMKGSALKEIQNEITCVKPIDEFCHFNRNLKLEIAPIPDFFNSPEFNFIKEAVPGSSFFLHEKGRTDGVVETCSLSSRTDVAFLKKMITHKHTMFPEPDDIIFNHLDAMPLAMKNYYFDKVCVDTEKALQLCINTISQSRSTDWKNARKCRITASVCYELHTYLSNNNPDWQSKIKRVFYSTYHGDDNTTFGKKHEETALGYYEKKFNCRALRLGLLVNENVPFLGFSPDAIIPNETGGILLEVKCPKAGRTLGMADMCSKLDYIRKASNSNSYIISCSHKYYGQMQLGMALAGIQSGKLLIYCDKGKDNCVVDVTFNETFCTTLIRNLTTVYFSFVLPYIFNNPQPNAPAN